MESDNSSGWVMSSFVTVSTGNQLSDGVSKSFVEGRSCATSIGGQIVSINCCMRMSLSEFVGAACKGGGASVGNSLLIMSSTDSVFEELAQASSIRRVVAAKGVSVGDTESVIGAIWESSECTFLRLKL